MGSLVDFPHADRVPDPCGDPFVDLIELRIIRCMVEFIQHGFLNGEARGLAWARADYLSCHPELAEEPVDGDRYLVAVISALKHISTRQQAKARHPSRSRAEVQQLLDGGTL